MSGYPSQASVAIRNRANSNQPGGLAKPEQPMATSFSSSSPSSNHMSGLAAAVRQYPDPEEKMDYEQANVPDYDETVSFEDL